MLGQDEQGLLPHGQEHVHGRGMDWRRQGRLWRDLATSTSTLRCDGNRSAGGQTRRYRHTSEQRARVEIYGSTWNARALKRADEAHEIVGAGVGEIWLSGRRVDGELRTLRAEKSNQPGF